MTNHFFWALACSSALFLSVSAQASSNQLADWANAANQTRININHPSPLKQIPSSTNPYFSQSKNPYGSPATALTSNYSASLTMPGSNKERYPVGKPTLECVIAAAQRQQAPVDVLLAINSIERGNTGQFVGNTNGTQDIGAFQINSIHLPRALTYQATREDLATRGCYNAEFAAMLLKEALTHNLMQNKDVYTRAAGYHSWTPKHNAVYKKKLVRYLGEWQAWLKANNMANLVTTR